MVDKLVGIGTAYEDLTHMRHVEHAGLMTDCVMFFCDVGVLDRHIEACKRAHQCTEGNVSVMKTGFQKSLFHCILCY